MLSREEGLKTLFFRDEKLERTWMYTQRVLSAFTRDGLVPIQVLLKLLKLKTSPPISTGNKSSHPILKYGGCGAAADAEADVQW